MISIRVLIRERNLDNSFNGVTLAFTGHRLHHLITTRLIAILFNEVILVMVGEARINMGNKR